MGILPVNYCHREKNNDNINIKNTVLVQLIPMPYELHLLHVGHVSPDKGQDSWSITVTETSYIWVTQYHYV